MDNINMCPKCNSVGEKICKLIIVHGEGKRMAQKWNECTGCGWEWSTTKQRRFNRKSYKRMLKFHKYR